MEKNQKYSGRGIIRQWKHENPLNYGIILVIVGIFLLLNNYGLIDLGQLWPVIIIAIGLFMIATHKK